MLWIHVFIHWIIRHLIIAISAITIIHYFCSKVWILLISVVMHAEWSLLNLVVIFGMQADNGKSYLLRNFHAKRSKIDCRIVSGMKVVCGARTCVFSLNRLKWVPQISDIIAQCRIIIGCILLLLQYWQMCFCSIINLLLLLSWYVLHDLLLAL